MDSSPVGQQMMEIEIKFAKGKVDFVTVHYGEDPVSLAKVNGLEQNSFFPGLMMSFISRSLYRSTI
jgi:hypothetical protein